MINISPSIFSKDYYYDVCHGFDYFKKSGGLKIHPRVKSMIDSLKLSKNMNILEIGCGRGDTALYIARKVKSIVGTDYSPDAIKIAKSIQKKYPKKIQKKSKFLIMDATKLNFKDNSFDMVLLIDTLDHLDLEDQNKTFKEISRVLKDGGELFLRTCSNRILLSKTYRYYTYPLNIFLTWIDKKIKRVDYPSLPSNPRTAEAETQHVNEPDYLRLKRLFQTYNFRGKIRSEIGFLKEGKGMRNALYNFIVALYPISKFYPLNIFFASSFICRLKIRK